MVVHTYIHTNTHTYALVQKSTGTHACTKTLDVWTISMAALQHQYRIQPQMTHTQTHAYTHTHKHTFSHLLSVLEIQTKSCFLTQCQGELRFCHHTITSFFTFSSIFCHVKILMWVSSALFYWLVFVCVCLFSILLFQPGLMDMFNGLKLWFLMYKSCDPYFSNQIIFCDQFTYNFDIAQLFKWKE